MTLSDTMPSQVHNRLGTCLSDIQTLHCIYAIKPNYRAINRHHIGHYPLQIGRSCFPPIKISNSSSDGISSLELFSSPSLVRRCAKSKRAASSIQKQHLLNISSGHKLFFKASFLHFVRRLLLIDPALVGIYGFVAWN